MNELMRSCEWVKCSLNGLRVLRSGRWSSGPVGGRATYVLLVEAEHQRLHVRAVRDVAPEARVVPHLVVLVAARLSCNRSVQHTQGTLYFYLYINLLICSEHFTACE